MFTNNYINFRHNMFFGAFKTGTETLGVFGKSLTDVNGESFDISSSNLSLENNDIGRNMNIGYCQEIANDGAAGLFFGSGSTPATINDYTLDSPITSGLSITNRVGKGTSKEADGKYVVFSMIKVKNTSDSTINICEVGCFSSFQVSSASSKKALMERHVLAEPIVLAAGEEKLITYNITFNQTQSVN